MNKTWKTEYLTNRLKKSHRILKKISNHDVLDNEELNDICVYNLSFVSDSEEDSFYI